MAIIVTVNTDTNATGTAFCPVIIIDDELNAKQTYYIREWYREEEAAYAQALVLVSSWVLNLSRELTVRGWIKEPQR